MSIESKQNRNKLLQDIEAYSCGEMPSPLVLARAPRIEEWSVNVTAASQALIVMGNVYRRLGFEDGSPIKTTQVMWFDRKHRWVRTLNNVYALGQQAGEEIPLDGI